MCIIVAKNKGVVLPTKRTLRTCFEHNKDGAGLMYVRDGKVIIDKGLMTFNDLWHKVKELKREFNSDLTDKAIVFHFRIGTHGENDAQTTHPFPISDNAEDLRATHFETDVAMVHNGIISSYNYDKVLSDTQSFIKDYVSVFKTLNKEFYKNDKVLNIFKKEVGTSKLCFLDKDENIYYIGDKVVDNGIIYSNSTYKEYTYKSSTYSWNDYDYDYYDYNYGYSSYNKTKTQTKENTTTLDDFIKKQVKYEFLEVGDFYYTEFEEDVVKENDVIIIDDKYNLYECIEGKDGNKKLSLIGKNAIVYNKYFRLKYLLFN